MRKRVILFTLQTFSTTGGIQKMTRTLGYCLYQLSKSENWDFKLWSLYDSNEDLITKYLPAENFTGFKHNRQRFIYQSLKKSLNPNVIIISHINLALIGIIVKIVNPKCKVWLIAHGIEVWRPLSFIKKLFLNQCDKILCVSNYTKQEIINWHAINPDKCDILNNAIDPFMKLPDNFHKSEQLLNRYGLTTETPVLFTLTRLASTEQYKGHYQVIKSLARLKISHPGIKYILSGKYDNDEEIRIRKLITEHGVNDQVILTGFIDESELPDYFLLADLFVLPSKKEGFGIVFIEALACGLPVICGNSDGSVDAIRNGELGKAITADNLNELENAITQCLSVKLTDEKRKQLQTRCLQYFNNQSYMINLKSLIANL